MIELGRWRTDTPPVGKIVEVWHINTVIMAIWDGALWRTPEGSTLSYISHWRVKK